jgi:beta-glucanase (GH16 family)
MRLAIPAAALCLLSACGGGASSGPRPTPGPTPTLPSTGSSAGWPLVWSDEFDGASGTVAEPTRWLMQTGGDGWGNNELEYYTDRAVNASHNGQGLLAITARAETYTGSDATTRSYTSARLNTSGGRLEQTYGKFTGRMKIPRGQGIWPALWMLGTNISTVGWPLCGEIDIMENVGHRPNTLVFSLHGPNYNSGQAINGEHTFPAPIADDFHVFTVEWEPSEIRWFVDDVMYQKRTPADFGGRLWVFDHPFFVLMNVAVGGNWPGSPDSTTVFPQSMLVDYVRVYSRN